LPKNRLNDRKNLSLSSSNVAIQILLKWAKPLIYKHPCESSFEARLLHFTAGARDEATPPAMSQTIAQRIAGAQLRSLDAAHLSAVEQPEAFARLLLDFWRDL
jgi:hypothetical protein